MTSTLDAFHSGSSVGVADADWRAKDGSLKRIIAGAMLATAVAAALFLNPLGSTAGLSPRHQKITPWHSTQSHVEIGADRNPEALLQRSFSITRTPAEQMGRSMITRIRNAVGAPAKILDQAVMQAATTPAGKIWLVASGEITCLAQTPSGSVTCESSVIVARRGIVLGTFDVPDQLNPKPHRFTVVGFAPDWAKKVLLKSAQGRRVIRVEGNAFGVRSSVPVHLLGFAR